MRSIFNSNYNSLQAKITKRFYGKTYIDANDRILVTVIADWASYNLMAGDQFKKIAA